MTDAFSQSEQTFFENEIGTISNKRVTFCRGKGSREGIPLQHITSVRLDMDRGYVDAAITFGIVVAIFWAGSGQSMFGALVFLCSAPTLMAMLMLWGCPTVVVETAGRDLNVLRNWPWKRCQANSFIEALRKQLPGKANEKSTVATTT